jgi:D-lactate dehydrogenase (cytochrome)
MNAYAALPRPALDVVAPIHARLAERLGARVTTAQAELDQHSHGEGLPAVGVPDLVVFPVTNEEVAFIVALCNEHKNAHIALPI